MMIYLPFQSFKYVILNFSIHFKDLIFNGGLGPHKLLSRPCLQPINSPSCLLETLPSPPIFLSSNLFHSKTVCNPLNSFISSTGSSSVSVPTDPSAQRLNLLRLCGRYVYGGLLVNPCFPKPHFDRGFSTLSSRVSTSSDALSTSTLPQELDSVEKVQIGNQGVSEIRGYGSPKYISDIIDLIRRNENDLESKLNSMKVSLSAASLSQIFQVLNSEKVSVLRFYDWIRGSLPDICWNHDVCSLVIANCGRLNDYEAMFRILNEFRPKGICLNLKAFEFLPVLFENKPAVMDSINKIVRVLNEVGGSCQSSGIRNLIDVLSRRGSFKLASFVMQITEKKASYYHTLIAEKCRRCDFKGVKAILYEMRQDGFEPNINNYNYVLSNLFKNGENEEANKLLKEMNCPLDELTYEIVICYFCKLRMFDSATELLAKMASDGLEPRLSTHATFIKGLFNSNRHEEAYKYVVDSSLKYGSSSNLVYSLLASLHQKRGNLIIASNVMSEMIKKGFRPHVAVYKRLIKHLQKSGRQDMAKDLENKFTSLSLQSTTTNGCYSMKL